MEDATVELLSLDASSGAGSTQDHCDGWVEGIEGNFPINRTILKGMHPVRASGT